MFQQNYQSNLSNLKLTKELFMLAKEVLDVTIYEIHLCLVNIVSQSQSVSLSLSPLPQNRLLYHKAVKEKN